MKLSNIHLTLGEQRKTQGLSQKDIAEALNVEQATVSLYENGKRGIPLELLDEWLGFLDIEVKIIPKGHEPIRPAEETKGDLEKFKELKKRRNYLIAEMRALMAEKIAQVPAFQKTEGESGEAQFWAYSFSADPSVGLVETRYDHPQQKYLAVEYTGSEVNVYKFLASHESWDGKSDRDIFNINRVYFTEDDFLTFGGQWDSDTFELRRVTILRENENFPEGVEIVNAEGFSLNALLEIQENHKQLAALWNQEDFLTEYAKKEDELVAILQKLIELSLNNRYENGKPHPEFTVWEETDKDAIDVPLYEPQRNWRWIEEGVAWEENLQETTENQVIANDIPYEVFFAEGEKE